MDHDKEDFLEQIQSVTGRMPPGARAMLKVLSHPDVIEHTKAYFHVLDNKTRCLKYDPPWSCAKDAEARYETVMDGWYGPGTELGFQGFGDGYKQHWCENCRKGRTEEEDL